MASLKKEEKTIKTQEKLLIYLPSITTLLHKSHTLKAMRSPFWKGF